MLFPVRCMTCNKVIGSLHKKYEEELKKGKSNKEILDELKINKICCRRMFLSNVDLFDSLINYA